MSAKELKIEAPEGYEVDWENSSMNTIRFKPIKKKITYYDVCRELFLHEPSWRLLENGVIVYAAISDSAISYSMLTAPSSKQLEQLLALNKLMNVAKYLNGDWEPDWNNEYENKFCIFHSFGKLNICNKGYSNFGCAVFKSRDLAFQAIEILGEEEVKKALGIFE